MGHFSHVLTLISLLLLAWLLLGLSQALIGQNYQWAAQTLGMGCLGGRFGDLHIAEVICLVNQAMGKMEGNPITISSIINLELSFMFHKYAYWWARSFPIII